MFRTILVGVDGATGGRAAAALARVLAESADARVVLAHAYPLDAHVSRATSAAFDADIQADARLLLERERDAAGLPDAELRPVGDLHAARALHSVAEQVDADVIVVGFAARRLGDTAASVLHASPVAVAIAPPRYTGGKLAEIGAGYDGTDEARHAVRLAARLAADRGARLRILSAVNDLAPLLSPYPMAYAAVTDWETYAGAARRAAQEGLDEVAATVDGVPVETELLDGAPADALAEASEKLDLLALGSHDYGPLTRVLLGSTSRALAHRTHCPLVVLPRGAHAPA